MNIKRFTKNMLVIFMAVVLLAGCQRPPKTSDTVRDMKITVIVDSVSDLSYNYGIVRELFLAETRYRDSGKINLAVNVFEMEVVTGNGKDRIESAFKDYSDLTIIANQVAIPILEPAVAYYPERDFILIDAEATGSNIYVAMFKPNEAAYLCGALAAKMSETRVIGIVIGMDIPQLHDFVVGYILGALEADPNCKVIISTVGNFYDADAGYELATNQFERGADICFSAAGGAGLGCIKAASDFGCYSIGVDVDQTEQVEPELKGAILTSCLKKFDSLIAVLLDRYIEGTLNFGELGRFGLKEGAVGIARNQYYLNSIPQNIQIEIDELEEKVSLGTIRVRSAFEMTHTEIDELFKSVRP
jgi:basic membrane protein A